MTLKTALYFVTFASVLFSTGMQPTLTMLSILFVVTFASYAYSVIQILASGVNDRFNYAGYAFCGLSFLMLSIMLDNGGITNSPLLPLARNIYDRFHTLDVNTLASHQGMWHFFFAFNLAASIGVACLGYHAFGFVGRQIEVRGDDDGMP